MKEKFTIFLKSFFYRIYSSVITFIISFIVTGRTNFSLAISIADFVIKIFTYYIYEFIWGKITKKQKNDN
jgi:uncharacterized membrane protein